jgi:hypothetical protein
MRRACRLTHESKVLGHASLTTTKKYLTIQRRELHRAVSLLETIWKPSQVEEQKSEQSRGHRHSVVNEKLCVLRVCRTGADERADERIAGAGVGPWWLVG